MCAGMRDVNQLPLLSERQAQALAIGERPTWESFGVKARSIRVAAGSVGTVPDLMRSVAWARSPTIEGEFTRGKDTETTSASTATHPAAQRAPASVEVSPELRPMASE